MTVEVISIKYEVLESRYEIYIACINWIETRYTHIWRTMLIYVIVNVRSIIYKILEVISVKDMSDLSR